jgi:hypothetical protein
MRYWNYLSKDLLLDSKRKPKYERKYMRGCVRKLKERKETV